MPTPVFPEHKLASIRRWGTGYLRYYILADYVCFSRLFFRIFGETLPPGSQRYIGEITPPDDLICR